MKFFIHVMVVIAFVISLSISAGADDFEYKEYEVQKGDTLWDIAQKELEDPFNWPLVWKANSWLKSPDWIYPGQTIKIPVGLLKKPETVPEVSVKPKAKPEKQAALPTVEKMEPTAMPLEISRDIIEISDDDIRMSGYISFDIPDDGKIIGQPSKRILVGEGDEIYIGRLGKPEEAEKFNVGEKYYVVRPATEVRHPVTKKPMGHLIRILGIIEVTRVGIADVTAKIIKGYDSIDVGDLLDNYYEVQPVYLTEKAREPKVEGYVVASTNMRLLNGILDVVYIDKGKDAGLEPGDVIASVFPGTPDRANGVLRVISTRDVTSTAVVLYDEFDVGIGHEVASCAKVLGCVSQ